MKSKKKEDDNKSGFKSILFYAFTIVLIVIAAFILIKIIGLFTRDAEPFYINANTNSKKVALKYVKEKYDITPKVLSKEIDKECTGFSFFGCQSDETLFGVTYKMKYKNKEFTVYVPYINSDNTKFDTPKDDYQIDEIRKSYIKYISEIIGDTPQDYEIDFGYGYGYETYSRSKNLFTEYYDGNNIKEITNKYDIIFTFSYINNIDLSQLNKVFPQNVKLNGKFVNYNSLEDYKKCKKENYSYLYDYGDPLYIKEELEYKKGSMYYYYYGNLKETSLPYVINSRTSDAYEIYKNSKKYITKSNDTEFINKDEDLDIVSPVYTIDIENSNSLRNKDIHLYIKQDEIRGFKIKEIDNYELAVIYYADNNSYVKHYNPKIIEDYLRADIDCDHNKIQFAVVKKKKN